MSAVWLWGMEIKDWSELPPIGITGDTVGNFKYDQTGVSKYVLNKQLFFIDPTVTLRINANISGNWTNESCGVVFCADGNKGDQKIISFNKGNVVFNINSSNLTAHGLGYFALTNGSEVTINSNLLINFWPGSASLDGVFRMDGSSLNIEDVNLSVDAWGKTLFKGVGASKISINQGGNYQNQTIRLYGDMSLGGNTEFGLKLGNQNSYYEGNINLSDSAKLDLYLLNSRAVILNYKQSERSDGKIELHSSTLEATLGTAKQTDLLMHSGSTWKMQGNSDIRNLTIQSSSIDFMLGRFGQPFFQKTLKANALSGAGTFILYADVQDKQIDTSTFAQASGHHKVKVFYNPHTFTQEKAAAITERDNMVVATINTADSQATFEGLSTDMGITSYKTNLVSRFQNGSIQWLISSITPDGDSPLSRVLSTALNTSYRLFDVTSSTLALRLGDLRDYPRNHGLYARYIVGLGDLKEGKNTLQTQDVWMSFAGGYDVNKPYRNHTDFFGIGFEVSMMDSKNVAYDSQTQAYGANLYYTSIFHNRFYYDVILKYAFSPNAFEFNNLYNLAGKASFDAHLITLGLEVGQKIRFSQSKNFFYLEPQGKLTSGVILPTGFEIRDVYQERIEGKLKMQIPLITRASLYFGYEWNQGFRGDLKLGSFVEYALSNGGDIFLKDSKSELSKSFDGDLDVGVSMMGSIEVEKFLRVYMQLDSEFLGDYASNVAFNMGVRWSFGERLEERRSSLPRPAVPPKDITRFKLRYQYKQPQRTIPVIQEDEVSNMKHHGIRLDEVEREYRKPPARSEPLLPNSAPERNEIRFYPQDGYRPSYPRESQKEYNRGNRRDTYIPQYRDSVGVSSGRMYKRDSKQ